jgi:hypothetical protein
MAIGTGPAHEIVDRSRRGQAYVDDLAARLGGPPSENELAAADRWIEQSSTRADGHRTS